MPGKFGIDCATGTIFVGAMAAGPGLPPQKMCGQMLKMAADRPLICAIHS